MKKALIGIVFCGWFSQLAAQEASSSYNVLRLPVSSHAAALGGENISNIEDSPAAAWSNPALMSNVSDKSLGLSLMTYNSGSLYLGAQYVQAFGERHSASVMAQMLSYGSMDETDETGRVIGSVSAKDIVLGAGYSYLLSDEWAGGATLRIIDQNYAGYTSIALGVDLGLNYFNEETDLSVSATARNIGAQVKSFYDGQSAHLPFTLQLGLTKGLEHLPVRFSVTMTDLTRWKSKYYFHPADVEKVSFGRMLTNHLVLGLDILPTDNIYLSLGYNARRAYELKSADAGKMAGFTLGGGLNLRRLKLGVSYAKYHVDNASLMFNVVYSFQASPNITR
ncbi:MAG: type IX secretion system protein PorQ [Alloprevotella sp.]|nr:type IX secretion system protein PorQ [Alloprevotella sp.]MBR1652415.1 type IX secretion system protein PorQ [Alloprevotella sp.]